MIFQEGKKPINGVAPVSIVNTVNHNVNNVNNVYTVKTINTVNTVNTANVAPLKPHNYPYNHNSPNGKTKNTTSNNNKTTSNNNTFYKNPNLSDSLLENEELKWDKPNIKINVTTVPDPLRKVVNNTKSNNKNVRSITPDEVKSKLNTEFLETEDFIKQETLYNINSKDNTYKENKITKEKYAMKTIKIQNNEDGAQKESEEMEYLKGINSPTVIKLKEFDIITGNLYLIIEYAEFGTLSDVIKSYATKKDHIPDDMIINWMTEILLGLYHIHEMGVLHRDIKSENLFLCKNSVVKIGDLGAARALGEGARAATMVGTTYYMSPEVMMNKDYSNIIDIWSVGVVFFELLSNTLPFKGLDAEEIKKKVVNVDYNLDLIPKTRNPELISLLKKMLVLKPEDRWKAIDCLQFRLINERLHYLLEEKIFEMDDDAKAKLMNIMPKLENNKVNISDGDKERIFSYFTDLEKAKKVDCTSIKSVYNPGFFKTKVYNVISGVDLDNSVNDLQLKQKDIEELLEKNLIMNINTPTSKELDYSNRVNYKVVTDEDPHIDNSIKYPFEQPKEDPLGLSIKCSIAVDKVLNKFNDEGQLDDGVDENVLKYKISTCKEYFDFLIEIRKLRKIVLSKCSKDQKLAIILNIYLTMFKHYQIKSYVSNSDYVPSMIENIFSMVFKPKSQIDVIYDIGGTVISLYEMKHIVIRRNKKPFEHYFFNLAGSSDPRINMINITNNSILERLLLICIDPVDNIDDYNLNLGYFEDNKIEEQIENRCKGFFQDNIKIDSGQILVPKFLQNYVKDFGPNPTDIIKFLLRFNTDPDVKANYVIKNFNENKVQINWY